MKQVSVKYIGGPLDNITEEVDCPPTPTLKVRNVTYRLGYSDVAGYVYRSSNPGRKKTDCGCG